MRRLRVACVGTGFIAGRHLTVLSGFPDVEVVAVADPVRERAEHAAARFGGSAYNDGLTLLDSEDLDALWLCVPPFAHGPLERAALDRNVPFFVEKPLANDLACAAAIGREVHHRGVLTAVGYHWRHLDVIKEASSLLREAPAQLVNGYWLDTTPAAPWWRRREQSGGQVLEQTTHIFDLARLLVGEVDTVQAAEGWMPREEFADADAPTASSAMLRFSSGAVGTISSTCVLGGRYRVGLRLVARGRVLEIWERSLSEHELRVVTADGEEVVTSQEDPIAREDREFLDTLQGRVERVRVPYAEALRTHALAWSADRSAREAVPVSFPASVLDE
jgi:myo-inositol 2-dehydrogenase/D-chiro-inositol 1-dehydrogenase